MNWLLLSQVTVGDTGQQQSVRDTSHVESDSDNSEADPSWKPTSDDGRPRKKPGRKKGTSMVSVPLIPAIWLSLIIEISSH